MAGGNVPADWEDNFEAMLQYAEGKGWLDDAGEAVEPTSNGSRDRLNDGD